MSTPKEGSSGVPSTENPPSYVCKYVRQIVNNKLSYFVSLDLLKCWTKLSQKKMVADSAILLQHTSAERKPVKFVREKYRVYVSKANETEDGDHLVDCSIVIYFHDDTGDLVRMVSLL
jgi:hypothetical protein